VSLEVEKIWQRGDGEMPAHVKHVVDAAQDELLLKTLHLPSEVIDTIRYNADSNSQTVHDYVSSIVIERLRAAS